MLSQMVRRILKEKRSARYAENLIVTFVAGSPWPSDSAPLFRDLLAAAPSADQQTRASFDKHLGVAHFRLLALGTALVHPKVRPLLLPPAYAIEPVKLPNAKPLKERQDQRTVAHSAIDVGSHPGTWSCPACTFDNIFDVTINSSEANRCSVCDTKRPLN